MENRWVFRQVLNVSMEELIDWSNCLRRNLPQFGTNNWKSSCHLCVKATIAQWTRGFERWNRGWVVLKCNPVWVYAVLYKPTKEYKRSYLNTCVCRKNTLQHFANSVTFKRGILLILIFFRQSNECSFYNLLKTNEMFEKHLKHSKKHFFFPMIKHESNILANQ